MSLQTPRQYNYDYNDKGSRTAIVTAGAENPMTAQQVVTQDSNQNPGRGDIFGIRGVLKDQQQSLAGPMDRRMGVRLGEVKTAPRISQVPPSGHPPTLPRWYDPTMHQPLFGLDMKSPATLIGVAAVAFIAFKMLKKK